MRIALLGATGRTGRLVIADALSQGCEVIALARHPGELDGVGVTAIGGDVRDRDAVSSVVQGVDAVVSAVGARGRDADLHTTLARNTLDAMTAAGVGRFVGISVGGLDVPGDEKGPRDRFIGALVRTLAGAASADRKREYEIWRESGLRWTLIRVPRLVDGTPAGPPDVDAHRPPRGIALHRETLAALLVNSVTSDRFEKCAPFAADR